jgi:hypothetical protein
VLVDDEPPLRVEQRAGHLGPVKGSREDVPAVLAADLVRLARLDGRVVRLDCLMGRFRLTAEFGREGLDAVGARVRAEVDGAVEVVELALQALEDALVEDLVGDAALLADHVDRELRVPLRLVPEALAVGVDEDAAVHHDGVRRQRARPADDGRVPLEGVHRREGAAEFGAPADPVPGVAVGAVVERVGDVVLAVVADHLPVPREAVGREDHLPRADRLLADRPGDDALDGAIFRNQLRHRRVRQQFRVRPRLDPIAHLGDEVLPVAPRRRVHPVLGVFRVLKIVNEV